MSVRIAINGVGRIGRALARIASQRGELDLVAVNDLGSSHQLAALLRHDTLHGPFSGEIESTAEELVINGNAVAVCNEPVAAQIDWRGSQPQIVVDATGLCKSRQQAATLRRDSVRKVLVSANAEDMDLTLCLGVNHAAYAADEHHLISAASCTTNCLAPLLFVLQREFGLKKAMFNTVHSYNNDQRLLSSPHPDPRRARDAALNMIPTGTSASHAIHRILPGLEGKIDGFAIRVPTPNVSLLDLVVELEKKAKIEAIQTAFATAATTDLAGILAVTEEELVSADYLGNPHSAIVDLPLTQTIEQGLIRVVAWYDNEWGHASRLADLMELVGKQL